MTPTTARGWRSAAVLATVALVSTLLAAAGSPMGDSTADVARLDAVDGVRFRVKPINLTAPKQVKVGSRIRLSGSVIVKKRKPRVVVLTERVTGRWRPVARERTTKGGTFKVRVAAGRQAGKRVFRASAPAARGLRALRSAPLRVRVVATKPAPAPTPTPSSLQEADDWSYLVPGGSRWNPCSTIRWAYNAAGERYDALADVTTAFDKIAAASGLAFAYVGSTTYRYRGSLAGFPSNADIAVGWATESELPDLAGSVVGVGGGFYLSASANDVDWRMVRGYLTLDKGGDVTPAPGFDGPGWGQIMMHETLHSLGLGHAQLSNQLMYPVASPRNYRFGLGDLTGMTKIGAPAGCLS